MTDDSSFRSVVVTGASSGIGRACALHLDGLGFTVFAGYRKDADAESLRADSSDRLVTVRLDVAEAGSIEAAARTIESHLGERGLDGLVNNAGVAVAAPLEFVPLDALRRQLEVNVVGQVAVTQALLPLIRKATGRIVNMSSISGRFSAPFLGPYTASKHALEALSDSLRVELRPWNIRVALIEPGAIATPIWEKSRETALKLQSDLPPEADTLYGKRLQGIQDYIANVVGTPTDPVVEAVVHALTSRSPRTRYLIGRDAKLRRALALLPTSIVDWLLAKSLRIE